MSETFKSSQFRCRFLLLFLTLDVRPTPPPPHTHTHIDTTREQLLGIYLCCQPWGRALETTDLGIRLPHDTRGFVSVMLLFQGCAGGRDGVGNLAL